MKDYFGNTIYINDEVIEIDAVEKVIYTVVDLFPDVYVKVQVPNKLVFYNFHTSKLKKIVNRVEQVTAYKDSKGGLHETREKALIQDIVSKYMLETHYNIDVAKQIMLQSVLEWAADKGYIKL